MTEPKPLGYRNARVGDCLNLQEFESGEVGLVIRDEPDVAYRLFPGTRIVVSGTSEDFLKEHRLDEPFEAMVGDPSEGSNDFMIIIHLGNSPKIVMLSKFPVGAQVRVKSILLGMPGG